MERIYLDWNATAPPLVEVREAMMRAMAQVPGNASSVHHEGQQARTLVERARRVLARAIGAPAQAVVFTGGATESNNQVIRDHVEATAEASLVCTAVEHPSVIEVVKSLGERGVRHAVWPVDRQGRLDLDWLRQRLKEGATLVSVMWANNEIGNVYPIAEIAELVHEYGALLHVDGTQALGRVPLHFGDAGIDVMTLSFHKMGGPKGVGAIVLKEGVKVGSLLAGGHQERGRRPGTENVPAVAGLEAAIEVLHRSGDRWREALAARRAYFLGRLLEEVPEMEVRGDQERCLPNTLNVAFPEIDGEDLLLALDLEGVSASSGSACTAGSLEPSHVVMAMGYTHREARRSVRFSFGPMTREEDLDEAAARVGRVVRRLSALEL